MTLPIWWGPESKGWREGRCPACRPGRSLRLGLYWTNGAPGEARQEDWRIPPGYAPGDDGAWERSGTYRASAGFRRGEAARIRKALRADPYLAGLAETPPTMPPLAQPNLGTPAGIGTIVICPRCGARVRFTRP